MLASFRRVGVGALITLLFVMFDFASPKQEKAFKSGSQTDINAIGRRKVGHGLNFYSLDREIALGKQLAQDVDSSAKLVDDAVVNEYINRIGQMLVRDSDAKVPFTFKVIDSDEVNAFALPGGFFYINRGLILSANEESELAGLMAHEIAHVCARHGTRNATKSDIAHYASTSLMLFGPGGWVGYAIYTGLQVGVPLAFLKFSRSAEREADFLGLQYMYKAGYDPNSFITFFERIDSQASTGRLSRMFSSHPLTRDRIRAAQREITTILPNRDEYVVTTSEFQAVKNRLLSSAVDQNRAPNGEGRKPVLRTRTD